MARPKKNTIDYFPHPVNDGSRMYIMEQKYGDKGYCCYYKLLQLLGRTENQVLDFTINKDLIFFSAILRETEIKVLEMISTMSEIGAIDKPLWDEKRVIWSQDLIDSIKIVYDNRKGLLPQKPILDVVSTNINPVNTNIKPQSIVEYSRVNKTKVNEINIPALSEFLDFVKLNTEKFDLIKNSAELKYKSWAENKWHDGNDKKIKNWKTKILNTIPHLKTTSDGNKNKSNGNATAIIERKDYSGGLV